MRTAAAPVVAVEIDPGQRVRGQELRGCREFVMDHRCRLGIVFSKEEKPRLMGVNIAGLEVRYLRVRSCLRRRNSLPTSPLPVAASLPGARVSAATWPDTAAERDECGCGVPIHVEAALRAHDEVPHPGRVFPCGHSGNCRHDILVAFAAVFSTGPTPGCLVDRRRGSCGMLVHCRTPLRADVR